MQHAFLLCAVVADALRKRLVRHRRLALRSHWPATARAPCSHRRWKRRSADGRRPRHLTNVVDDTPLDALKIAAAATSAQGGSPTKANAVDDYDGKSFPIPVVLAPGIWLLVVWLSFISMLALVGYLAVERHPDAVAATRELLRDTTPDFAARRGALALSGVALALTAAMAGVAGFWAWAAARSYCVPSYHRRVLGGVAIFLLNTLAIAFLRTDADWGPFTSQLGNVLLEPKSSQSDAWGAPHVPDLMLFLSCVVPAVLLAGACFLLQPMTLIEPVHDAWEWQKKALQAQTRRQLGVLARRLRELDQMLYIGGLALVFGTLQLSAGLSLPLASLPKAADVKHRADVCKTIAPASATAGPFFGPPEPKAKEARVQAAAKLIAVAPGGVVDEKAQKAAKAAAADIAQVAARAASAPSSMAAFEGACQGVPLALSKLDAAESLRGLVRNLTLCFGLAFSALLAAVYVPAFFVLRNMVEERQHALDAPPAADIGTTDAFSRIAAVVATLSPLLAGLVANTLTGQ